MHFRKAGGDITGKRLHVFATTRRRIQAKTVNVKIEGARPCCLVATLPRHGIIRKNQFPNTVASCEPLDIPMRLSLENHQIVTLDWIQLSMPIGQTVAQEPPSFNQHGCDEKYQEFDVRKRVTDHDRG
tara:strand:+ start:460 stop:843 length:384 start_codon:yes stop_codon:yes gene_type:complete